MDVPTSPHHSIERERNGYNLPRKRNLRLIYGSFITKKVNLCLVFGCRWTEQGDLLPVCGPLLFPEKKYFWKSKNTFPWWMINHKSIHCFRSIWPLFLFPKYVSLLLLLTSVPLSRWEMAKKVSWHKRGKTYTRHQSVYTELNPLPLPQFIVVWDGWVWVIFPLLLIKEGKGKDFLFHSHSK